jgi:hypothetical protein
MPAEIRRALEPDRDQLEIFADAVLRHRGSEGFLSLRSFYESDDSKPAFRKSAVLLKGNFRFLIDCAVDDARRAAQAPQPVVFAPPLACSTMGIARTRPFCCRRGEC